jgi:hypothetical protein
VIGPSFDSPEVNRARRQLRIIGKLKSDQTASPIPPGCFRRSIATGAKLRLARLVISVPDTKGIRSHEPLFMKIKLFVPNGGF